MVLLANWKLRYYYQVNLDLIERCELVPKKDTAEIERMLKALIKCIEKTPWILGPSFPTKLEKNQKR
jgi:hypothetical protein